jgi:hypothetical protein
VREVKSPEGHTWRIERVRSEGETVERDSFFWPSVIMTILIVALLLVMLLVVQSTIAWILTLVVLGIWVLERTSNAVRPSIRASTDGPPPATYVWKTRHRYGYDRIEAEIADEISRGDIGSEPEGATLVSSG